MLSHNGCESCFASTYKSHDPYANGDNQKGVLSPTNIMVDWVQGEYACLLNIPLLLCGMCFVGAHVRNNS
jgi:hypothetical protein